MSDDGANMKNIAKSSEDGWEPDETSLALLVACHHRGPLTSPELDRLLAPATSIEDDLRALVDAGLLEFGVSGYGISQPGRESLDHVLESIQSQLSPDDPAYVRRFRREAPSLPFDADTVWAEAVCVNFRVDPLVLRPMIPTVFELDLFEETAFISLTVSRLKDFGVGWVPRALRMNFYQSTYRAHVTYTDFRGRIMKGCYFVRSETNSPLMSMTANMLPEFRAHRCSTFPMLMARRGAHWVLTVDSGEDPAGKVVLVLDTDRELATMPEGSIFRSKQAAYDFIVDFEDAFAYEADTGEVFILRIDRGEWDIKVIEPVDHYFGYFTNGPFSSQNAELDSVFYFTDVPYRWLPLLKERVDRK